MDADWALSAAGLVVGFVVGLTGMGGGALMTPALVLLFGVHPTAAVSTDILVSLVMKPVGAAVHFSRNTVNLPLVLWLTAGSMPAAFAGALILGLSDIGPDMTRRVIGGVLLLAAAAMILKPLVAGRRKEGGDGETAVRPVVTAAIGVVGGLLVGLTSVGSGSVMLVLLYFAYPRMPANRLVGTDLTQAVPLIAAALVGHALFGDIRLDVSLALLIGAIPGVYFGARLSSRADEAWLRPVLAIVLVGSGLKLLGAF